MKLRDLFSDDATIDPRAAIAEVRAATEVTAPTEVTGLVDSRAVKPGDVFFALAGSKTDGARFIDAAIASGAVAVVGEHPPQGESRIVSARCNPRRALAMAAANFIRGSLRPSQPSPAPTAGRRSPPSRRQIWQRLGHASASIGTIGLALAEAHHLRIVDDAGSDRASSARRNREQQHRRRCSERGSTSFASTACGSAPAGSPTCRATTWITTPMWRIILPPRPPVRELVAADGVAVISADHDHSGAVIDAARQRGLRFVDMAATATACLMGFAWSTPASMALRREADELISRPQALRSGCRWSANSRSTCAGCRRPGDWHRQRARSRARHAGTT